MRALIQFTFWCERRSKENVQQRAELQHHIDTVGAPSSVAPPPPSFWLPTQQS